MKSLVILFFLIISNSTICGQDKMMEIDATFVVTYPFSTSSMGIPDSVLARFNYSIPDSVHQVLRNSSEGLSGLDLIEFKESEFDQELDFFADFTRQLQVYLGFSMMEAIPNILIYPSKVSIANDVAKIKKQAIQLNVNWIINISYVEIELRNSTYQGQVQYQVYNRLTDQILIDKEVQIESVNHGFMFACPAGEIECLTTDFVYKSGDRIIKAMFAEEKYWR